MSEERAISIRSDGAKKKKLLPRPNVYLPEELANSLNELAEKALSMPIEPPHNRLTDEASIPTEPNQKVTFYLTAVQEEKLDDLVYEYRKQRAQRINRNDIIRYLIDQVSIDDLANL